MGSKKNIIVGAASVYLGPSGIVKPAYATSTSYRSTMANANGSTYGPTATGSQVTDWRDVGYTESGLTVVTTPTYNDVTVDQLLDAAKIFKSAMTVTIGTTFAEATLENLLVAWGQTSSSLSSSGGGFASQPLEAGDKEVSLDGGSLGAAPLERGLIAVGNAVEESSVSKYGERVYHAYRVTQVEANTHVLARDAATTLPVNFRALSDDSTGRYGLVRDRMNV